MSSIKVEEMPAMEMDGGPLELPPGFRFHPTDEEIITHYLTKKVANNNFEAKAIGEVDLNRCEPWDLSSKAKMGEKEWYFFCQRDRKYPTGMRTNRATESGYWKATGKDKEIYKGRNCLVGMKKTLVFYKGRAPKGEKTNWVMHEYRLDGTSSHYNLPTATKDSWVVCRVFHKSEGLKKAPLAEEPKADSFGMELQSEDDYFASPSMPSILDSPRYNPSDGHSYFLDDGDRDFKAITPSSSYPSYLQSTMDTGNLQAFKSSMLHHTPQVNPYNMQKSPISYPQSPFPHAYHSFESSPNAGVAHQERNHNFTFNENAMLRGAAAVRSHSNLSMGGAPQKTGSNIGSNTEVSSEVSKHEVDKLIPSVR